MLRANPDLWIMDCTYRTNKFRLPLLHMLGCTGVETFFSIGFCFLRTETYEDYRWAISTLLEIAHVPNPNVFISDHEKALVNAAKDLLGDVPQLLCVWHINMNVLTKVNRIWRVADGKTPDERDKFQELREAFMARWRQVRSACV